MNKTVITLGFLLCICFQMQGQISLNAIVSPTWSNVQVNIPDVSPKWGPVQKHNSNIRPTIGLTTGMEVGFFNRPNFALNTGILYNLSGAHVQYEFEGGTSVGGHYLEGWKIDRSVRAHYLQLPLTADIKILDPIILRAGLSYNYSLKYTDDFKAIFNPYLSRSDFRGLIGIGYVIGKFVVFAHFENSLVHFADPYKEGSESLEGAIVETYNRNIQLGVKMSLVQN